MRLGPRTRGRPSIIEILPISHRVRNRIGNCRWRFWPVRVIRKPLRYVNTSGRDPHATADALSFHRGILQNLPSWRSPLALAFTGTVLLNRLTANRTSRGDGGPRHHTYITHTAICASTMYLGKIIAGAYMPSTCAIRIELRSARTDFQCSSPSSTYPSGNSP